MGAVLPQAAASDQRAEVRLPAGPSLPIPESRAYTEAMGLAPRTLRRVGVLGDIHAEHERLATALRFLAEQGVDATFAVGDLVDGPGDADRTLSLLREFGVLAVRGNHERWFLDGERRDKPDATQTLEEANRSYLHSLPITREHSTPSGRLLVCHGVGDDDLAVLEPETRGYALQDIPTLRELMLRSDLQFMLGGHTHKRMVRPFPGLTVINAGTLFREHQPCFGVVDFERRRLEFFELSSATTVERGPTFEVPSPTLPDELRS